MSVIVTFSVLSFMKATDTLQCAYEKRRLTLLPKSSEPFIIFSGSAAITLPLVLFSRLNVIEVALIDVDIRIPIYEMLGVFDIRPVVCHEFHLIAIHRHCPRSTFF